jgi:hypothetical protein
VHDIKMERRRENTLYFETILAMAATAMFALVFCLGFGVRAGLGLIVIGASSLFIGGIVFSLLEMHRLATRNRELTLIAMTAEIEACEARLAAQRVQAQRETVDVPIGSEPYRHHEHHRESPGLDQGQLTTALAGSTPFFEKDEN